jgi:hypothetical protein
MFHHHLPTSFTVLYVPRYDLYEPGGGVLYFGDVVIFVLLYSMITV